VVASATYAPRRLFVSATEIYGSGLTNGEDPDASYGTGLFDFNKSIKVSPSFILNASAGYTFTAGRTLIRPQIYVDNIFDRKYLLKGAFFSGASVGRPRSVQAKVDVSL
jgi:outer membrane receptor for Fe3+-dicitrate